MESLKGVMEVVSLIGGILFGSMLILAPVTNLFRFVCRKRGDRKDGSAGEGQGKIRLIAIAIHSALFSYGIYVVAGSINYYVDVNTSPKLSSVTADLMSAAIYIFVAVCVLGMLGAGIYQRAIEKKERKT